MSRRITREPEPTPYVKGEPVPEDCALVYALEGYATRRSKKPSALVYALAVSDLPHGGWVAQGLYREVTVPVLVQANSGLHRAAVNNSRIKRRERMEDDAQVFADVAGDNAGLHPLLAILSEQADLWARNEAHGTKEDLRDYMHRCIYVLAARLLHDADGLAEALDVAWGADLDGGE
jgi:hypothetical protein